MSARRPCPPALGPVEDYAVHFDAVFHSLAQRHNFRTFEPSEFEEVIANWFSAKGYQVERNWNGRYSGYDFAIYPFRGERALVEVKKYKQTSQVPVSTIRQMVGSMAIENARYGIVVSSSPFTHAAKYFSSEIGQQLLLLTLEDLNSLEAVDRYAIDHLVKG